MCRASEAATARCMAANTLMQTCEQRYGIAATLHAVHRPIADDTFDDILRRVDAVKRGQQ